MKQIQKQQDIADWTVPLQPLVDITNLNLKAAQKIIELQSSFMSYFVDAHLKQFQVLAESKDVKSAMERQLAFFNEIDTKWCDTAEQ